MSPEALARLCEAARLITGETGTDLRALLDAYDTAMHDGRTVVECADEMRQQWAEIEERLTEERDTARAEGVAAERTRVVAWLRGDDGPADFGEMYFQLLAYADRIERGEHDKEGEQ